MRWAIWPKVEATTSGHEADAPADGAVTGGAEDGAEVAATAPPQPARADTRTSAAAAGRALSTCRTRIRRTVKREPSRAINAVLGSDFSHVCGAARARASRQKAP